MTLGVDDLPATEQDAPHQKMPFRAAFTVRHADQKGVGIVQCPVVDVLADTTKGGAAIAVLATCTLEGIAIGGVLLCMLAAVASCLLDLLVGGVDLFHFFVRHFVKIGIGVFVGMIFTDQLSIGLLDLLIRRTWADTEYFIGIHHIDLLAFFRDLQSRSRPQMTS